jgi:hypothetical protein
LKCVFEFLFTQAATEEAERAIPLQTNAKRARDGEGESPNKKQRAGPEVLTLHINSSGSLFTVPG